MKTDRITLWASASVLWAGMFWGLYWLPVRALSEMGLAGAWGTVTITVAAVFVLAPFVVAKGGKLLRANWVALTSIALGGGAFALYSIGFVYGRVAIILLLWFLSPVWSTLIGRYIMGWPTPRMRLVVIAVGLAGLVLMLGAEGDLPLPQGIGEWMGLIGGILWSFSTTGIRAKSDIEPVSSAFVFALGAAIVSLALAPILEPVPTFRAETSFGILALALLTGGLWWGLSIASLMWATVRLDPARVSILLMTEVAVGSVSAALLAQEHLHPLEIIGGALVLISGLLEVWPTRGATRVPARDGSKPRRRK